MYIQNRLSKQTKKEFQKPKFIIHLTTLFAIRLKKYKKMAEIEEDLAARKYSLEFVAKKNIFLREVPVLERIGFKGVFLCLKQTLYILGLIRIYCTML